MSSSRNSGQRKRRQAGSRTPQGRNKRVSGEARARRRPPLDPEQRRARNRIILSLSLLGLVNVWAFSDAKSTLASFDHLRDASIPTRKAGPLPPLAEAREEACGGDPVRVFEGLSDLLALDGALTGGYTLRLGLLRLGVASSQIDRIEAAIRGTFDLNLLGGSGAPFRVAMDRHGTVHALEVELAEGHLLQACRQHGEFEVRNLQHPLRSEVDVVNLELGKDADLATAVAAAGEKPELASLIARTLASDIDFMVDARPGDRIDVMIEKRWLGRGFHRYGTVLAVRLRANAAHASYYRYKPRGLEQGDFDPEGRPMRRARLRSPVGFYAVNPEARGLLAPTVEVVEGRLGAVYRVPEGAPLVAIGEGKVREVTKTVEDGNVLDIEYSDGTIVRYAHLLRTLGDLRPGVPVQQGQVVALGGHSGRTPSDRVRVEVWRQVEGVMQTIDPLEFFADSGQHNAPVGAAIPKDQLAAFKRDISGWNEALDRG